MTITENQLRLPLAPCPATQFDSTGTILIGPYINSRTYVFNCLPTYVLVPSLTVTSSYKCVNGVWDKPFEKCYGKRVKGLQ